MFCNINSILTSTQVYIDDDRVKKHISFKFVEESNHYTPDGKNKQEFKEYHAKQCELGDFGPYSNHTQYLFDAWSGYSLVCLELNHTDHEGPELEGDAAALKSSMI